MLQSKQRVLARMLVSMSGGAKVVPVAVVMNRSVERFGVANFFPRRPSIMSQNRVARNFPRFHFHGWHPSPTNISARNLHPESHTVASQLALSLA